MRREDVKETEINEGVYNPDEDGMGYYGMFTEINGKVVYQETK